MTALTILAIIIALEGLVIMTALGYKLISSQTAEKGTTVQSADEPEEQKAKDAEKAISDGIQNIQAYDYFKAKEAVRNYAEDEG